MKTGLTISTVGHVAVVAWAMVTFAAAPPTLAPPESLPVDVISTTDFSQITAGQRNAPKTEQKQPLVEKVEQPKPVDDMRAKIDKKVVEAATDSPPLPEPKPPEPKKQTEPSPPQAKPEPKPVEAATPKPTPQPDLIAEALKKSEAQKPAPKQAEAKTPLPQKRPKPQPQYDPNKIAALLDKREPTRNAATGVDLNQGVTLGLSSANARQLSQSELDALRARLAQFWNPPVGARNPNELVVQVRLRLNRDGTLAAPPQVLTSGSSTLFMAARESAVRAIFRGQPFTMLNPANYDTWKDVEITFDPRDMIRG
jgi:colicin import membrane protein